MEKSAKNKIGSTEPYSPKTAGKPDTSAYPIEIGIETAAIIIPAVRSFPKYSFCNSLM